MAAPVGVQSLGVVHYRHSHPGATGIAGAAWKVPWKVRWAPHSVCGVRTRLRTTAEPVSVTGVAVPVLCPSCRR